MILRTAALLEEAQRSGSLSPRDGFSGTELEDIDTFLEDLAIRAWGGDVPANVWLPPRKFAYDKGWPPPPGKNQWSWLVALEVGLNNSKSFFESLLHDSGPGIHEGNAAPASRVPSNPRLGTGIGNNALSNPTPRAPKKWPFAFWIGAASLAFLALLLVFGRGIACEQRGVFVAFVALAVALAFGFFGRSAELSGALPTIFGGPRTLRLSLAGGAAVFGLVMFYGGPTLFGRKWDDCTQPPIPMIVIDVKDLSDDSPLPDARVSIKIGSSTFNRVTDQFGQAEVQPEVDWKTQLASIVLTAEGYEQLNYNNTIPTTGRVVLKPKKKQAATVLPPPDSKDAPERLIVALDGKVSQSIATWADGTRSRSWNCIEVPDGFDLVIVRSHRVNLGRRRGQCVGPGSYCNSTSEYCIDETVDSGCYVNNKWHEWYKAAIGRIGAPYSRAAVCDTGKDVVTRRNPNVPPQPICTQLHLTPGEYNCSSTDTLVGPGRVLVGCVGGGTCNIIKGAESEDGKGCFGIPSTQDVVSSQIVSLMPSEVLCPRNGAIDVRVWRTAEQLAVAQRRACYSAGAVCN